MKMALRSAVVINHESGIYRKRPLQNRLGAGGTVRPEAETHCFAVKLYRSAAPTRQVLLKSPKILAAGKSTGNQDAGNFHEGDYHQGRTHGAPHVKPGDATLGRRMEVRDEMA
jgi:hypothetical protein